MRAFEPHFSRVQRHNQLERASINASVRARRHFVTGRIGLPIAEHTRIIDGVRPSAVASARRHVIQKMPLAPLPLHRWQMIFQIRIKATLQGTGGLLDPPITGDAVAQRVCQVVDLVIAQRGDQKFQQRG